MKKREKKNIVPNECSFFRWLVMTAASFPIGIIIGKPIFRWINSLMPVTLMGIDSELIMTLVAFVFLFAGFVVALRLIAKISLKDFVLGAGGKVNMKECLLILGLYMIGYLAMMFLGASTIRLRGVQVGEYVFLVVLMLLIAWCQTTWEELIFRGVLFRWICKNKFCFNKKSFIAIVVTTVAFMLSHGGNTEVTSQSGLNAMLAISTYAIPALVYAIADFHFGSLLPGILLHWLNNFLSFTLLGTDSNAMPLPTLLVSGAGHSGPIPVISLFLGSLLPYMPVLVYVFWDAWRKKKAGTAC